MSENGKNRYRFERYSDAPRWASYYYQLREALALAPRRVLAVGVGDGVFHSYLKQNTSIECVTLDIAPHTRPDVTGNVLSIPFPNGSFDAVCAFEVLEHLPFSEFEKALGELKRVTRKHVLLSLPHFGPPVQLLLKIPLFPKLAASFKIPYAPAHRRTGEHEWELGKKGYSPRKIRAILKKHFTLEKEFVPFENQYHHFFVLSK